MDGRRLRFFPSIRLAFVATCALACAGALALAQPATTIVAIETMSVGAAPPDFDFERTGRGKPGQWVVTADTTATGGRAIEQSSADTTDNRFPLAIYRP